MKTTILIILLLQINSTFTQEISQLFYGKDKDKCFGIEQLNDSLFVLGNNSYIGNTSMINPNNASVILYNSNTKKIISKKFLNFGNITFVRFVVVDSINNEIYTLSLYYDDSIKYITVTKYDYSLNIINQTSFQYDYYLLSAALLNDNGNLVFVALKNNISSNEIIIIESNAEFGIINETDLSTENMVNPTTLAYINSNYFLYSFSNKWIVLDQNFNTDTSFYSIKPSLSTQNSYNLNQKMYYGGITGDRKEIINSIDLSTFEQDTVYSSDYSFLFNHAQRGYYTIDGNDDGYIYCSNTIGGCNPSSNSQICKNYVSIHKIDTLGNLQWEYYIGGDSASYLSQHLVATKDGGCIVVFDMFNFESPYGNEDVYYIKFDSTGQIDSDFFKNIGIYTTIKKNPKVNSFLLYPNPVQDKIIIVSSDTKNKQFTITNSSGKTILREELTNIIDVNYFISDTYFYTISENGFIIQTGKFIKD